MANPSITQGGKVDATKLHVYITENTGTAIGWADDLKVTPVSALLAASIQFKKVETGLTMTEEAGDSITETTGIIDQITKNLSGEFNVFGLLPADYEALIDSTTGLQLQDVDVAMVNAPANRALGTVKADDELFVVEKVNLSMRLVVADGQPTKLNMSVDRIDAASAQSISWYTIIADA